MLAKGKHHKQATQEPGVRAFLEERGFRPAAEQKLGGRATALRIFPLDEHPDRNYRLHVGQPKAARPAQTRTGPKASEDAEAIKAHVNARVEIIAHELRAVYEQRLEKALSNGIFDEATNRTRMQAMYRSALLERLNWSELEREAAEAVRAGKPVPGVAPPSTAKRGSLSFKLEKLAFPLRQVRQQLSIVRHLSRSVQRGSLGRWGAGARQGPVHEQQAALTPQQAALEAGSPRSSASGAAGVAMT